MSELYNAIDKTAMLEFYKERLKLPKFPKGMTL